MTLKESVEGSDRRYPNMKTNLELSEEEVVHLGRVFLDWAQKDKKAFKCLDFFIERGWCVDTPANWAKKYPEFRRLYDSGKYLIGSRRERNYKREYDSAVITKTLHFYDKEYRKQYQEDIEHKAQVLNPQSESDKTVIVVDELNAE